MKAHALRKGTPPMSDFYFEQIEDDVYYLKIPFGPVFTSVTLILDEAPILVDTGATEKDVDGILAPALAKLGLTVGDLRFVTVTHCHGDHIGGLKRLSELGNDAFQLTVFEKSAPKVADPVPYAIRIRTAFPEYSPAPQSFLQGVPADAVLKEGALVGDRLEILHTPGHDDDAVSLLDRKTGILLTGDSLQGNGTVSQGIGFYQSLPDYLSALQKMKARTDLKTVLLGHDYDGIGYLVSGEDAVKDALGYASERVRVYHRFVAAHREEAMPDIAVKLIEKEGCGMPERLFMALYTVREHLKLLEQGITAEDL